MHTFFIDTTSEETFADFQPFFYKEIEDFNLTEIKENLFSISDSVQKIQQIVDKEVEVRNKFNIVFTVEINERTLPLNMTAEEFKNLFTFYVNYSLINPIVQLGYVPYQVIVVYVENHPDYNTYQNLRDRNEVAQSSISIWPWHKLDNRISQYFETPIKKEVMEFWFDQLKSNQNKMFRIEDGEKVCLDFFNALNDYYERLKTVNFETEESLKERFDEDSDYFKELLKSFYNNYFQTNRFVYPTEFSIDLFQKDSEEKKRKLLSTSNFINNFSLNDVPEEDIIIISETGQEFELDKELRKSFIKLSNNKNFLDNSKEPTIEKFDESLLTEKDNLELEDVKFHVTLLQDETEQAFKGFFSLRKIESLVNNFTQRVKEITTHNQELFDEDVHKLIEKFKIYKQQILKKPDTNKLLSQDTISSNQESVNYYKKELEKDQTDLKMKLADQNLGGLKNKDFTSQLNNFQQTTKVYLDSLKNFKIMNLVLIILLVIVSVLVPYYFTDNLDTDLSVYVFWITAIVFLSVCIGAIFYHIHRMKKQLHMIINQFQKDFDENQQQYQEIYNQLYERFNYYIPSLLYLNQYEDWFDDKVDEYTYVSNKRKYHLKAIEDHLKNLERINSIFQWNNDLEADNFYENEKMVDIDKDIVGNADIYSINSMGIQEGS